MIFLVGIEPLLKEKANEAGKVYNSILEAWDSIKIVSELVVGILIDDVLCEYSYDFVNDLILCPSYFLF